jgi:hypothetical protein
MSYINKVANGQVIRPHDRFGLQEFADELLITTNSLRALNHLHEINSADNLRKVASRLPEWAYHKWLNHVHSLRLANKPALIDELSSFVAIEAAKMNDPVYGDLHTKRPEVTNSNRQTNSRVNFNRPIEMKTPVKSAVYLQANALCPKCSGGHTIFKCISFKQLSVAERIKFVRDQGLCDMCFKRGHKSSDCSWIPNCGIDGCTKRHARFLHVRPTSSNSFSLNPHLDSPPPDNIPPIGIHPNFPPTRIHPNVQSTFIQPNVPPTRMQYNPSPIIDSNNDSNSPTVNSSDATPPASQSYKSFEVEELCSLPLVLIRVSDDQHENYIVGYCLLDSGSDISFCSNSVIEQLNLPYRDSKLYLTTLNQENSLQMSKITNLTVTDIDGGNPIRIPHVYSKDRLPVRWLTGSDQQPEGCG